MTTLESVRSERGATVVRAGKFGAVGLLGLVVNLAAQAALTEFAHWNYLVAAIAATQVSSTFNFVAAESWVFEGNGRSALWGRYVSFLAMNNAALVLRAPMMWLLVDGLGTHYSLANLVSLGVLTVLRFGIADRLIWKQDVRPPEDGFPASDAEVFVMAPTPPVLSSSIDEELHPVVRTILRMQQFLLRRAGGDAAEPDRSARLPRPPTPAAAGADSADAGRAEADDNAPAPPRTISSMGERDQTTYSATTAASPADPRAGEGLVVDDTASSGNHLVRVGSDGATPLTTSEESGSSDPSSEKSLDIPHELSRRTQIVGLTTIVAVGAVLRLWKLMAVGFNSDEAVYSSQAAAIARDPAIVQYFPIFRAHPFLFQAMLSVPYQFGTNDLVGRLASVLFGLATLVVLFATARLLYGPRVGLAATGLVAVMPYHIIVTRQVLLDGPMTFFATLSLYFMARFVLRRQLVWLLCASCALGLTTLAKETYIILVGSVFMFFALNPEIRLRIREFALAAGVFVLVLLPFPITIFLAGKSDTGKSYLSWQLFRRPNHGLTFYPAILPPFIGYAVLIGAVVGLVLTRRRRTWKERLLISWIAVPVVFLEIWPVKGFHYLLAATMPLAILAGLGLCGLVDRLAERFRRLPSRPMLSAGRRPIVWATTSVALVVSVSMVVPAWRAVQPATDESFLAGTGGVPGGREVGEWIDEHVPEGAEFMTVGPSMANLIQYYGRRRAYGLSVSPNPLNRNPSYVPIINPDLAIRTSNLQYVVWDSYSSKRSSFFGDKLLSYAERYNGRLIYSYAPAGRPLILVYEVRP